jgi:hypothetical protein
MWPVVAGILTASVILASLHQYAEKSAAAKSSSKPGPPLLLDKPERPPSGQPKQNVFTADIWRKLSRGLKK